MDFARILDHIIGYLTRERFKCPLCGRRIRGGGARKVVYGSNREFAQCVPCGVEFESYWPSRSWKMIAPEAEWLIERISPDGLARLNKKLLRYRLIGQQWRDFLARCRDTDELWRFRRLDGETAIAIVRDGMPIAEFSVFGSL